MYLFSESIYLLMDSMKILVRINHPQNMKSTTTEFINSIVPEIRKMTPVEIIWLVYKYEKLTINEKNHSCIDIHDYPNMIEIIQNIKPDLIYASPSWEVFDYTINLTGRHLGIPTFAEQPSDIQLISTSRNFFYRLFSYFQQFFRSDSMGDADYEQRVFMKRGRFYLFKLKFMINTLNKLKFSKTQIIKELFLLIKTTLVDPQGFGKLNPKFRNTVTFLENEESKIPYLKSGRDENSLVVTGNPQYDEVFRKSISLKKSSKRNNKIHVLLVPGTLYEHGWVIKKHRDDMIKNIVLAFNDKKEEFELRIKIHPSSAKLEDYQQIIESINCSVDIIQNGYIDQYLDWADVVISDYFSSALIYALIFKKPILICNFFEREKEIIVKNNTAMECTDPNMVSFFTKKVINDYSNNIKNIEKFLEDSFYKKDGKSAERIANVLISITKNRPDSC